MKVYVAAYFTQQKIARAVAEALPLYGHLCTAQWVYESDDDPLDAAMRDVSDIERADALLLLPVDNGGCGMWIEMGMALARGKVVYVLGTNRRSVFHHLPGVRMISSLKEIA